MYNKFNQYILELENSAEDFWYDVGIISASKIMSQFVKEDWENMINDLPNKTLDWKKKVAYCIDNNCSPYELKCLFLLADTEDEELLAITADSLREFINENTINIFRVERELLDNISRLKDTVGIATRKILEDFLSRINRFI